MSQKKLYFPLNILTEIFICLCVIRKFYVNLHHKMWKDMTIPVLRIMMFILVVALVLFGVAGLLFGLARLLSAFGKPGTRWKHFAAVMVPTIAIFTFVILFTILGMLFSYMIGVDPLGDYEAPLKHRYTVLVENGHYQSMEYCDVLDRQNCCVVYEVVAMYMDGNMLYGRCIDNAQGYYEGFALNMRTGQCEPAEVNYSRLKSVKEFCAERDRKLYKPLNRLAILMSAAAAFFIGQRYFKIIRESEKQLSLHDQI